ncbi:thymosin beta-10-like [Rattus norvegicus]|uniref:thymosin beta-10-like n=1 Tax=Rattus norvegicus TaxID=10116 RepID=UPI0019177FBD|nr:thymosin beta-10-like [Rattus norvegicus]
MWSSIAVALVGLLLQQAGNENPQSCKKMADRPDVGEIASFNKAKLKKIKMQEKNTLPTNETIEQEKRSELLKV